MLSDEASHSWRGHRAGQDAFARAAVFWSQEDQRSFYESCDAEASNPERPTFRHTASLVVTEEQLRSVLLFARESESLEGCTEFVLNPRDYPLLTSPGLGGSHLPVLSQYSHEGLDLRLPSTAEDYARCWPGLRFGRNQRPAEALPEPPAWEGRRSCAVFRGAATGGGVTPSTNARLRLVRLAAAWGDQGSPYLGLLDAKLTSWNLRQKRGSDGVTRLLNPRRAVERWGIEPAGPWNFLSWSEQARFKYAVYLEGNVGASRLGAMLGLGFVVLAPPHRGPCTHLWTLLRPGEHYVELAEDLSDLGERLLWLRSHDDAARSFSCAARELWLRSCTREAVEENVAAQLRALPACGSSPEGLLELFRRARSGIYCLADRRRGQLRLFVPFANESFANDLDWRFDPGPLSVFLRYVEKVTGEAVVLPPHRWWTNGALVCNVPPADVWGEGLWPQLRLLLERAAARLRGREINPWATTPGSAPGADAGR